MEVISNLGREHNLILLEVMEDHTHAINVVWLGKVEGRAGHRSNYDVHAMLHSRFCKGGSGWIFAFSASELILMFAAAQMS